MPNSQEEMALTLAGRKSNFSNENLVNYFGEERLGLSKIIVEQTLKEIETQRAAWEKLIQISFLLEEMKKKYIDLVVQRWNKLYPKK